MINAKNLEVVNSVGNDLMLTAVPSKKKKERKNRFQPLVVKSVRHLYTFCVDF